MTSLLSNQSSVGRSPDSRGGLRQWTAAAAVVIASQLCHGLLAQGTAPVLVQSPVFSGGIPSAMMQPVPFAGSAPVRQATFPMTRMMTPVPVNSQNPTAGGQTDSEGVPQPVEPGPAPTPSMETTPHAITSPETGIAPATSVTEYYGQDAELLSSGCDVCGNSWNSGPGMMAWPEFMDPNSGAECSSCDVCGDSYSGDMYGLESAIPCGDVCGVPMQPWTPGPMQIPQQPWYPSPIAPAVPFADSCDAGCGEVCGCEIWCPCGEVRRWWLEGSALIWWTTPSRSPALATTSDPAANVPQASAGVLGQDTTRVLFGDNQMLNDSTAGFRMRQGHWFDSCGTWGFDTEYFVLGKATDELTLTSTGDPIIARPFTNALTGLQDSQIVAYPGLNAGTLDIELASRLQSGAIHLRRTLVQTCRPGDPCTGRGFRNFTIGFQTGPRVIGLREKLTLTENTTAAANGNQLSIYDGFRTRNRFMGCEVGLYASSQRRRFSLDGGIRLAVGQMRNELDVSGQTVITEANGNVTTLPGGILAQRTNIRSADKSSLGFVPQMDIALGYKLTDTWKFSVGYNLLYLNRVLRATEQIDPVLNPNLLPPEADPFSGPLRPGPLMNDSDFLAHGISLGLEKRW